MSEKPYNNQYVGDGVTVHHNGSRYWFKQYRNGASNEVSLDEASFANLLEFVERVKGVDIVVRQRVRAEN